MTPGDSSMSPLWLYRAITYAGAPFIKALLQRRLSAGKEDLDRFSERKGIASVPRPDGKLIWLHAASIGESQSSLALIERLLSGRPDLHVLQTTGTLTSARLMQDRLPERSFHQFAPIDRLPWVRRFLDHWQPDMALWMESELWPNLVLEARRRNIPSVLVNARMSNRSFHRWRRFSGTARKLLQSFSMSLAQTEEQAAYLRQLGADPVMYLGNLKFSATPLPFESTALDTLAAAVAGRPVWLAASTHAGEEEIAATVHTRLTKTWPDLLTVIVPRHPARGDQIAQELRARGFTVTQRSCDGNSLADIYIGDTLGELGLFYRLSKIAFIGGSMAHHGGHNPLEAAQLDCAVVLGPDMGNFATVARGLLETKAALQASTTDEIVESVSTLLHNGTERDLMAAAAADIAIRNADAVERIHDEISRLMDDR